MSDDTQRFTFRNGPMHGAVLEVPPALAVGFERRRLVITTGGGVFDKDLQRVLAGIRVVEHPRAREVTPAPRKRGRRGIPKSVPSAAFLEPAPPKRKRTPKA